MRLIVLLLLVGLVVGKSDAQQDLFVNKGTQRKLFIPNEWVNAAHDLDDWIADSFQEAIEYVDSFDDLVRFYSGGGLIGVLLRVSGGAEDFSVHQIPKILDTVLEAFVYGVCNNALVGGIIDKACAEILERAICALTLGTMVGCQSENVDFDSPQKKSKQDQLRTAANDFVLKNTIACYLYLAVQKLNLPLCDSMQQGIVRFFGNAVVEMKESMDPPYGTICYFTRVCACNQCPFACDYQDGFLTNQCSMEYVLSSTKQLSLEADRIGVVPGPIYHFKTRSGKFLRLRGNNEIGQANSPERFEKWSLITKNDGYYSLLNHYHGKFLIAKESGNGVEVVSEISDSIGDRHLWVKVAIGVSSTKRCLRNKITQKYLQAKDDGTIDAESTSCCSDCEWDFIPYYIGKVARLPTLGPAIIINGDTSFFSATIDEYPKCEIECLKRKCLIFQYDDSDHACSVYGSFTSSMPGPQPLFNRYTYYRKYYWDKIPNTKLTGTPVVTYSQFYGGSSDFCMNLCAGHPDCIAFSFTAGGSCSLFDTAEIANGDDVIGFKPITGWKEITDSRISFSYNRVHATVDAKNVDHCQNLCLLNANCAGIDWNNNKVCTLLRYVKVDIGDGSQTGFIKPDTPEFITYDLFEGLQIYSEESFKGTRWRFTTNQPSLSVHNANDKMKSFTVAEGYYVRLYRDSNYNGNRVVAGPGSYHTMKHQRKEISSLRVGKVSTGVKFYRHTDLGGTSILFSDVTEESSLSNNDYYSSFTLSEEYVLTVYEHAGFGGRKRIFHAGVYLEMPVESDGFSWNDKISSFKLETFR